jgi:O-antigen ligase
VALVLIVAAAACAGCVFLTAALRVDRVRMPTGPGRAMAAGTIAFAVLVALTVANAPISRAWDQFNDQDRPASGPDPAQRLTTAGGTRSEIWGSAIDAFQAHPLDGVGPGTFEYWWSRDARNPEFVRDAHSLYLEQMAELGLPGLLLLLGGFASLTAVALHARARLRDPSDLGAMAAMCAAFIVFLVSAGVDWMWEETAVGALAVAGIAIAGAAGSERLRRRERSAPLSRPGVRAALVILALAAAAVQVPGIVSTDRLRDSQVAVRARDLPLAAQLAQSSVDAEPWAAAPRVQLGLVRERQGDLSAALRSLEDARSKERQNWRIPLAIARVELKRGDRAAARRAFAEGRALAPLSPYFDPGSAFALSLRSQPQRPLIQP